MRILPAVATTGLFFHVERRGMIQVIPDGLRRFWMKWQVRVLVLFSLVLQISLILLGKRRKKATPKIWLRVSVWSAYILANWVATVALGVIANHIQAKPNKAAPSDDDLISFWAPFLLLHLGGPDTITAYSLEDNELWQRRFLELLTQTTVAFYIFLMAWPGDSWPSLLTIPMLISGFIKFGERIWSLRSASTDQFRDSLLTEPDPGPNYAKFMEEYTLKKAEGFFVKADEVREAPVLTSDSKPVDQNRLLVEAYKFFHTYKRLFVDLILSFQDRDESQSFFHNDAVDCSKAFHVVEVELGFVYDILYTKAPIIYTPIGCLLKLISFTATLLVLILFMFKSKGNSCHYHVIDLVITYSLLVVALLLEIYSGIVLLYSDWTSCRLRKHLQRLPDWTNCCLRKNLPQFSDRRWSNSMAQYSFMNVCECVKKTPPIFRCRTLMNLFKVDKALKEAHYLTYEEVSSELKELIFTRFREMSKNEKNLTTLCKSRGNITLERNNCKRELEWSTAEVDFDQSILIWHIATELCYYADGRSSGTGRIESKKMSDYMLYLLAMCPFMLPTGIGMIRFRDTCAEADTFFNEKRKKGFDEAQACRMLLRVNTEVPPVKVKGDRSKSVLFDAVRLATYLRQNDKETKWKMISDVWVEILAYAASHCRGDQHARQLRKGGELLTHVWLLMAHLGITDQFQISRGHARAKLSAK